MFPLSRNFLKFAAAGAVVAFTYPGLVTPSASADKLKDSGSVDMTYVEHCGQPIPDEDDHMFVFNVGEGTSTNKGGLVDGFSVRFWEITDLRQGGGIQQGYVTYSKGSDQRVDRVDGIVTTILKDGQPRTTFEGKWVMIKGTGTLAGIEAEGTYAGYFTADDRFHVDWEGSRSQPKGAVTKPQE